MDLYDFSEVKEPPHKIRPSGIFWNILTILVLVVMFCIAAFFVIIYLNPNSALNPFPPPTNNPALAPATSTIVPRITLVSSWTPTQEIIQAANTPEPTFTQLMTSTVLEDPTEIIPPETPNPDGYAFAAQEGSPSAIAGSQFHSDAGCQWLGVGGQATSMNGESVRGLFVVVGGSLPGVSQVDNITMTGLAPQYGVGGFEITLSNELVASENTLWVQLQDAQNLPLSPRVYFSTYADCDKNLIIIYFDQVR
jgi:heme/copper-type cytochrome/quinol oxidase subunit 2